MVLIALTTGVLGTTHIRIYVAVRSEKVLKSSSPHIIKFDEYETPVAGVDAFLGNLTSG